MKEPHTALFVAPTVVGKTHLALSLLENEYRNHFNFIVIICPTLAHNELARIKAELKLGKHTCLIMRMEHPRAYMIR